MSTPGSFGNSLRNHDYRDAAEFLVLAGVNGNLSLEDALNSLYNDYIRLKRDEFKNKDRRIAKHDRRVEDQSMVRSGSSLHVVRCLESVAKNFSLNEDEREVLSQYQAKIRRDGTANGFRNSDRRKSF